MSTSKGEKCGLSSFLPMSCRGRAEAFARRLHSRLHSLGSQNENGVNENSWLGGTLQNSVALSQPRHSTDADLFFDIGLFEQPGSPEEELDESELKALINQDNLKVFQPEDFVYSKTKEIKVPKSNGLVFASNDSDDSCGSFYDTENGFEELEKKENGFTTENSDSICSNKFHNPILEVNSSQENSTTTSDEVFASTSECTIPPSDFSMTEGISTLSFDEEPDIETDLKQLILEEYKVSDIINEIKQNGVNDSQECFESEISLGLDSIKCESETKLNVSSRLDRDFTLEYVPTNEIRNIKITIQNSSVVEEDVTEDEPIPRVRRCSSLKTGKTPPGTPGRKKIVRFADVLGLDLADVKTFVDEIPKVPTSAYDDLCDADLSDDLSTENSIKFHGIKIDKMLVPLFEQPGSKSDFLDKVRENWVCLENALVDDPTAFSIKGMVRVRNVDFHKSVHIRYSLDLWQSFADVQAVYLENSCDGFSDKFSFLIYAHTLTVGQRLEFAVRFQSKGCQYWDNNSDANYCFQCLPSTNNQITYGDTSTSPDDHWGASFY